MVNFKELLKKNPLFFAFFFPALADGIFTLLGQDISYWEKGVVNEASPVYYILLASPRIFVFGTGLWFALWYWIFKKLKEPFNLFFMFLFIAGHSWGSSSWIWKIMRTNGFYTPENQISVMIAWSVVVLYFALIALFATSCLRTYIGRKEN